MIKNQKGSSIIEYVILLSVLLMILSLAFPTLRTTLSDSIHTITNVEEQVTQNELAEDVTVESNILTNKNELTKTNKLSFSSNGEEQALRLGRGYDYDLKHLQENINPNIAEFHYIEDNFFNDKMVYFELEGENYTSTLNN